MRKIEIFNFRSQDIINPIPVANVNVQIITDEQNEISFSLIALPPL
jgi:hypothetical protein